MAILRYPYFQAHHLAIRLIWYNTVLQAVQEPFCSNYWSSFSTFLCVESSQLTQHSNPTVHIRGPIAILCVKVSEPKFQLSCCRRACSWSRYVSVLVPCRWNDTEKAPTERGKTLHQEEMIYTCHIYCAPFSSFG